MNLIDNIPNVLQCVHVAEDLSDVAVRALPLIDLTARNENTSYACVEQLCGQAITPYGHVAAVCVPPKFVKDAKKQLSDSPIRVVALVKMQGKQSTAKTVSAIEQSIADHADAVEILFPYQDYLSGKVKKVEAFIRECSLACSHQSLLKVILEAGVFPSLDKVYEASQLLIHTGIDGIKTASSYKQTDVTLEIAAAILSAIKESGEKVGFKSSVGIDTVLKSAEYLALADQIMGEHWVTPETFRFGADETLLNDVKLAIESKLED